MCYWLASRGLSQYTSSFVSLHLNSLRKVAAATNDDLSKVHRKFCASTALSGLHSENDDVGRLVMLKEAVQSLKDDERTKTLQDQLDDYSDPKVSGLNLIGAQHQLEVAMAQQGYRWFFIWVLIVVTLYQAIYSGIAIMEMSGQTNSYNLMTYGVQLSLNSTSWWPVVCQDAIVEGPCIFDSSNLISRSEEVVSNLFSRQQKARYVKILPGTWESMRRGSNHDVIGPEFRLGVLGALGEVYLRYSVVSEGSSGQAWLQPGCSRNSTTLRNGMWALLEEEIGMVQCCIDSPGVHVCTRYGRHG